MGFPEMFEYMIVLIIVFFAIFFTGKRLYKAFTGRNPGCGCGFIGCPAVRGSEETRYVRCPYGKKDGKTDERACTIMYER